jgi:glycerophosphoryl diester phosphodiesterase
MPPFDLQGHRGARGLKPENTLASFEIAFDLGVTTIETDVHLTRDGVPVLFHDAQVSERLCRLLPGTEGLDLTRRPLVSTLALVQLRQCRADRNPEPGRFPSQDNDVTPLGALFADGHGIDPYTPPTLADLLAFSLAYAGELGEQVGKTESQRARANSVRFDLELKRIPFEPEVIGDAFDGAAPGVLEERVVAEVTHFGMVDRTLVRSFDHRSVWAVRQLEPHLTTAVLIAGIAPMEPAELVRRAEAQIYCPEYLFLDRRQVMQLHAEGIRVVPWTVNRRAEWLRLLDWGVDGITTDYPDTLAHLLREREIEY